MFDSNHLHVSGLLKGNRSVQSKPKQAREEHSKTPITSHGAQGPVSASVPQAPQGHFSRDLLNLGIEPTTFRRHAGFSNHQDTTDYCRQMDRTYRINPNVPIWIKSKLLNCKVNVQTGLVFESFFVLYCIFSPSCWLYSHPSRAAQSPRDSGDSEERQIRVKSWGKPPPPAARKNLSSHSSDRRRQKPYRLPAPRQEDNRELKTDFLSNGWKYKSFSW